jgi:DNA-binding response OmpR family regulator
MKEKLLIVDDSVTIQKIVAMAFENENMVVQGASNGKEALEKLKDFHPDIIITDVDMPGIDGFEVSRKIREQEAFKSVPILLLTSDFEEFNEALFKRSLASDHLSKPFKSEKIVEKVHQLLDSSAENSSEQLDDTQSIKELNSEVSKDSSENAEITETVASVEDSPLTSSNENQLEEESSAEILENLKQETEKTANIVKPDDIQSQPAMDSEETISSSTAKKPEDMTIEELLASAEALLEENYMETEDGPSDPTQSSQKNIDPNQVSEVTEPVLLEEETNSEPLDTAQNKENEPSLEDGPSTLKVTNNTQDKIDEIPSSEEDFTDNQKENLVFENSLESELKQLQEDPILEESNLHEDLEKSTEQIEASDLDDSFLHSPISEKDTAIENDPLVETETTAPTDVHTEWLTDETTAPKIEEEPVSKDNLFETKNENQDDNKSQETIEELDAVFESIQNFENQIKNADYEETNIELSTPEPSSLEAPKIDTEEPTEEEIMPIPHKVESDLVLEEESSSQKPNFASDFSDYNISPEPDNLLEKLAPAAFDTPGAEGRPDLIQETLAYLSELTPEPSKTKPKEKTKPAPSEKKEIHMNSEPIGDMFVKVVGEHVKRILERSLEETIAREISGLSKTIERSVKEVVKEVTPEITRSIIQEEIEKIRKLEEV